MTIRVYSGFDADRIGDIILGWNDGSARSATIAADTFAHINFPALTASTYIDFATAAQTALNAVNAGNTFTYDAATMAYTWSRAGAFTITTVTNTVARRITGFSTLPSASLASHTSHVRPWYVCAGASGAQSGQSPPTRERPGHTTVRYSGRRPFGITIPDVPKFQDFTLQFETKEAVFKDYATAAVPFTFEQLVESARAYEPIAVVNTDPAETLLYMLTEEGANWDPSRVVVDWDGYFHVPFGCQRLGRA